MLFPIITYRLLLAEMVWITADQSQLNLDCSPVRMLTMWLLRTSYIATIQKYRIVSVTTKTIKALPTYV